MDVFTFVVIVVLIGCGSGVISKYLENKRTRIASEEEESLRAELNKLQDRVEVLERILTDEKYRLSREIDHLERRA